MELAELPRKDKGVKAWAESEAELPEQVEPPDSVSSSVIVPFEGDQPFGPTLPSPQPGTQTVSTEPTP